VDPDREEDCARVAAFPFTTIAPNIGTGYFSAQSPARRIGLPEAVTAAVSGAHGLAADGAQLLPVVFKDVAGLVPGAYQGRGKGNAFLNDLCDADVLIHVVDASGMSDSSGVELAPGEGDSPVLEVSFLARVNLWQYPLPGHRASVNAERLASCMGSARCQFKFKTDAEFP